MVITKLRIDGQFFHVDPAEDIPGLRAQVLAAAQETAYVDFEAVGHGSVSVLMSPGMPARFEALEVDDDELEEFEEHPPIPDMDQWHGLDPIGDYPSE